MDVVVDRVAGLDVHKRIVVASVRTPAEDGGGRVEVTRTFCTFTVELRRLVAWLVEQRVAVAVMEATGVFWLPVWYALTDAGLRTEVVNAGHLSCPDFPDSVVCLFQAAVGLLWSAYRTSLGVW